MTKLRRRYVKFRQNRIYNTCRVNYKCKLTYWSRHCKTLYCVFCSLYGLLNFVTYCHWRHTTCVLSKTVLTLQTALVPHRITFIRRKEVKVNKFRVNFVYVLAYSYRHNRQESVTSWIGAIRKLDNFKLPSVHLMYSSHGRRNIRRTHNGKCIFEVALTMIQPIVILMMKEFQVLKRLYATLFVFKYDNEMLTWTIYAD